MSAIYTTMLSCRLSGRYRVLVFRGDSVRDTGWLDNLITDTGMDQIGTGPFITLVQVGTGTTAADPTDTALETLLGTSTDLVEQTSGLDYSYPESEHCMNRAPYGYGRWTFNFAADTVVGTITEVGAGWDTGLFSRLVLDNPIEVVAGDTLTVIYELRNYPRTAFGESRFPNNIYFSLGGEDYQWQAYPANITSGETDYGWGVLADGLTSVLPVTAYREPVDFDAYYALGPDGLWLCAQPEGADTADAVSTELAEYVPGSYYREVVATWGGADADWVDGINAFLLAVPGLGCFQMSTYNSQDPYEDPVIRGPIVKSGRPLALTFSVSWVTDTFIP